MNIRISVKAEAQLRALLRSLEELPAAAVVAKFDAVPGADPLDAIATGAHSSGPALARFALQLGIDAIGRGFGLDFDAERERTRASAEQGIEGAPAAVKAPKRAAKVVKRAERPAVQAAEAISEAELRARVDRKLAEHGERLAELAARCSKRGSVWTPEHVAVIFTLAQLIEGSPGEALPITTREAIDLANAAGYHNAVQAKNVKPLTPGTFRNHRTRLMSADDDG